MQLDITIINCGGGGDAVLMRQEARGWSVPKDGSKFWLNLPSSFRVMGVGFGGSDGGADLFHRRG